MVLDHIERVALHITGTVQGVGFRPYVFALAKRLRLVGWVRNQGGSVRVEIEGISHNIKTFLNELDACPPPLARIEQILATHLSLVREPNFTIRPSIESEDILSFAPSDVATCHACLCELRSPSSRRYNHPFINCVNCGPRFTLIEAMPYDRAKTTMREFALCDACLSEYQNPENRRHHAQPIACPNCGPKLELLSMTSAPIQDLDPVDHVVHALRHGAIVAIKGLGGFFLSCDAKNSTALKRLRHWKQRAAKPFAVMVNDLRAARRLCVISHDEENALVSPSRPIVLLRKRPNIRIAPEVCPLSPELGVMLPYTPIHHLLLSAMDGAALVMTSANRSGEPIVYQDHEAIPRLASGTDLILTHNRSIAIRCDDSVLRIQSPMGRKTQRIFIRRSRGYAPEAIRLPFSTQIPILAVGGNQKNTFALTLNQHARLSHHIGDLHHFPNYLCYQKDISHFESLFQISPQVLAHDLHPDYNSTHYAKKRAQNENLKTIAVQHHHAHMASCMAEHGLTENVIGVVFDGNGYGLDGNIWGGEFLIGNYHKFHRAAHLKNVPMPGGEKAIREPWRMATSHLISAGLDPFQVLKNIPRDRLQILLRMMENRINCPLTSSIGRLFDAVAALLGLCMETTFEGQAAVQLEWLSATCAENSLYTFPLNLPQQLFQKPIVIDPSALIREVAQDFSRGVTGAKIARQFHLTLADLIARVSMILRKHHGLNKVVLSGGVFLNRLLLSESLKRLKREDFEVFCQSVVPPNDGGLSLGQSAVAAVQMMKE